jgi:hypothetical protein
MERSHTRDFRRIARLRTAIALAAAVSGCVRSIETAPSPEAGRETFQAYARSLAFVGSDWDNQAGDEQPMLYSATDPRNTPVGPSAPVARVEPEARANRLTRSQARQPHIVGRILSTGRYEPLGLQPGVNYVWLEGTTAGGWRGLIVPDNTAAPIARLEVVVEVGLHDEAGATWHYYGDVGMLFWIIVDDMCVGFAPVGRHPGRLRPRLLRPEMVGGRPDPPHRRPGLWR